MNQLDALKLFTTVVADSGDIEAIRHYHPEDATTNPSLILKAAGLSACQPLITEATDYARQQGGSRETQLINACDRVAINVGIEILNSIPGRISTEVDARLSFDRGMCVTKAEKLIRMYEERGIDRSRVLIKLAATWEGIRAAEELEKKGIHCNLTLLFSFAQARACAEAGVFLISPFVGRIYDWYQTKDPQSDYDVANDPGVASVRNIYQYYKQHRYETIIMGASFRNPEQVLALAGCDRLTISPELLRVLQQSEHPVKRQLVPSTNVLTPPSPMSEAEFRWQHNEDAMAEEKLAEGIRLLARDQRLLEALLLNHLEASV
ncbi:MAG: Transaldolase [Candidatus Erwinia impunctatus]|nr:Transaldolase [Culicoides impunctatus]